MIIWVHFVFNITLYCFYCYCQSYWGLINTFSKFHENRNIHSQRMAILRQIKARRALFIATPYSYVFWWFLNVGWKITLVRMLKIWALWTLFSFNRGHGGTNIKQFQDAPIPVIVYNYSVHFLRRLVKKWRSILMKHTPFTHIHTHTHTHTPNYIHIHHLSAGQSYIPYWCLGLQHRANFLRNS